MDLLKELKPYQKHIDAFKAGYGITDTMAITNIADIWDRFADTRKLEIYGSATIIIPKTKTNCSSCVKDMMVMVSNWQRIVSREAPLVEFKGVPQAKVVEVVTIEQPTNPKFQDLKKEASKLGVNFTPKTNKIELIKLIAEKKK